MIMDTAINRNSQLKKGGFEVPFFGGFGSVTGLGKIILKTRKK